MPEERLDLTASLRGRIVMPGHEAFEDGSPGGPGWPMHFKPDSSGQYWAVVVSAWTHATGVWLALVDPEGNCGEAMFSLVTMQPQRGATQEQPAD